ncbi:hypothetical protein AB0K60_28910 [Thermopolyspora sp. NPDC052614]|uniref:hypothetical protein n=1 Tax=Thermopolyspora sp. NPDC052614 TaxID=3155682 RepID=UPI00342819B1
MLRRPTPPERSGTGVARGDRPAYRAVRAGVKDSSGRSAGSSRARWGPHTSANAFPGTPQVGQSLFRLLRAGLFAVVCVAVSLAVHMLAGGGSTVRPGVLAATVALTAVGAFALAGRQRGFGALLIACFAAQYGMHRVFSLAAIEPAAALSHDMSGMSGAVELSGHQHGGGLWQDVVMLALHAMTAIVSAWWLEREERALATMLHLLAVSASGLWARLSPSPSPVAVPEFVRLPVYGRPDTATVRLLAATVWRRGPPLGHPVS